MRTALQHSWAMTVELLADVWGQQIKYGRAPRRDQIGLDIAVDPDSAVRGVMVSAELLAKLEVLEAEALGLEKRYPNNPDAVSVLAESAALRREWLDRMGTALDAPAVGH